MSKQHRLNLPETQDCYPSLAVSDTERSDSAVPSVNQVSGLNLARTGGSCSLYKD